MKTETYIKIGAGLFVALIIIRLICIVNLSADELRVQAEEKLAEHNILFEKARVKYCAKVGKLESKCYATTGKRKIKACTISRELQDWYNEYYAIPSEVDCIAEPEQVDLSQKNES